MTERCDYLLPSYFGHYAELDGIGHAPCRLQQGHDGPHLVEGVHSYLEWQPPEICPEPEECEDSVSCEHFDFWLVSLACAIDRIVKEGPRA